MDDLQLRAVVEADLPIFFAHQQGAGENRGFANARRAEIAALGLELRGA